MTARRAALLLAGCVPLAWAITARRAAAQDSAAPAPASAAQPVSGASGAAAADAAGAAGAGRTERGAPAPLTRRVSLALTDVTLGAALQEIASQSGINLSYSGRVVPVSRRVSAHFTDVTVRVALDAVLAGTGIEVREEEGRIILARRHHVKTSEEGEADTVGHAAVVVRVVDTTTSQPIPGTVVGVKGTKLTATTSQQGYALLRSVPSGLQVVTVRFLGYVPAEKQIVVPDSGYTRVSFTLRMGMSRLQEVVTTATGQRRRYELGNDITILNVDSITATQPITSVTDLLEGRVPGLTVQHTSGAPGDPSRLRLRGTSSVLRGNDPIVIVDGIRVYSAQSDSTSGNVASSQFGGFFHNASGGATSLAAPSPLDQLDPHSIETIEVLKGPSAATLYGPDAANGVIVITTKRGQAGPARWTASASRGTSYMPGQYPTGIYSLGQNSLGDLQLCTLTDFRCHADSVVRFQALNDDRYSVLGHGQTTNVSLGVSGGSAALTYALTGSYDDQTGILRLPDVEAARFATLHGGAAPPDWMQRPQQLTRWSGTSRLTAKLGARADASLSTTLTREKQQRSTLEQQISTLMGTYIDVADGTYYRTSGTLLSKTDELVPDFYQRATDDATNFTNAANVTWRPLSWLTTSADGGINVISRDDEVLLPRGMKLSRDTSGLLNIGHGGSVVSTVNLRATATAPLPLGFHLQLATGANYSKTSQSALTTGVSGLAPGTSSLNGADEIELATQSASDVTSFGWYLEPTFTHRKFTISTGLRLDGSSTFGANVHLPAFPKLGVSWLISEEPFFPFKNFFDVFRVRAAYGRAGVWPGPADQLRLYTTTRPWLDGGFQDALDVLKIGNSALRPERSSEMEGGFDADMFGDRLSVELTGYRKMRYDAIMNVPVAPSVYGNLVNMLRNIGVIRNTGLELNVTTQLVRTDPFTWSTTFNLSRNHNQVTELGAGVTPFGSNDSRVVAGYPLFGRWARPILGYADVDSNHVITRNEVQLGDTLVFMGSSEPNYEANLFSTFSFLRGALTASVGFGYEDGLTQVNRAIGGPGQSIFSPGLSDPSSSFAQQAAVAVMSETSYGLLQTVSTLRLNSVSVSFNAPPSLARRFGTQALSIALQGMNVGLWTNYAGKDPNVNAFSTGNAVMDTGVLPMPRSWQLSVHATY
ncbi:MAG TPA: TonB-dependent receptor plug domain-containing protein [Gemmatimonadaceae bacterium]|nr:TonB-dependent receptor plug domain-containing protein [Gemmatimonadaceae bacterium]